MGTAVAGLSSRHGIFSAALVRSVGTDGVRLATLVEITPGNVGMAGAPDISALN